MPCSKQPSTRRRCTTTVFSGYRFCRAKDKPRFFRLLAEGFARRGDAFLMREAFREIGESASDLAEDLYAKASSGTRVWHEVGGNCVISATPPFVRPGVDPAAFGRTAFSPSGDPVRDLETFLRAAGLGATDPLPPELAPAFLATMIAGDFYGGLGAVSRATKSGIPQEILRDAARLCFRVGIGWRAVYLLQVSGVRLSDPVPWTRRVPVEETPWPEPIICAPRCVAEPAEAVYDFPDLRFAIDRCDLLALTPLADGSLTASGSLSRRSVVATRYFARWHHRIVALDDALATANA